MYLPSPPHTYKRRETIQRHLDGMLKSGVIKDVTGSYQPWNARVFLISKPHQPGKFRFVADFRSLNSQCLPDTYQLPNIKTVTDKMAGANWFSTVDLSKSFYQLPYDKDSVNLTAFTGNHRQYVFQRMVMGHLSSSCQFVRMVDQLLHSVYMDRLAYFLDDLCLASKDIETHISRLSLLLDKLADASLKLMPSKCNLLRRSLEFVGWTISEKGLSINEERVLAVKELLPPAGSFSKI